MKQRFKKIILMNATGDGLAMKKEYEQLLFTQHDATMAII